MSIGIFESFIITPFERLKTQKMTATENFAYLKHMQFKSIYVGFQIQTARQITSWTSYLYWDHKLRYYLKKDYHTRISLVNTIIASTITSFLNIAVG